MSSWKWKLGMEMETCNKGCWKGAWALSKLKQYSLATILGIAEFVW